jgi:hypothetical protein
MSSQDFEHVLERVAPISYSFHNRPPTLKELVDLSQKAAHEVHRYFADLPSKERPEISAGDYVKAFQAARPWARQHLEREPVSVEVAVLHHSSEHPNDYFSRLAAQNTPQQDGVQVAVGRDTGEGGVRTPGGQEARQ